MTVIIWIITGLCGGERKLMNKTKTGKKLKQTSTTLLPLNKKPKKNKRERDRQTDRHTERVSEKNKRKKPCEKLKHCT